MVVRKLHPIGPQIIRHLQGIAYLLSRQTHGVKHIFVLIQIEHIVHKNVSLADFRVIGQGSRKRNIRPADCQLQFMDKVYKSGRAEIGRTCGDGLGKGTYLLGNKILHSFIFGGKALHELFADAVVLRIGQYAVYLLVYNFTITQFQGYIHITHNDTVAGRVHHQYRVTGYVAHPLAFARMVVPHQDNIESRHVARHFHRSVFAILASHQLGILAGMEHTDNQIRLFLLTDNLHPFAGSLLHIVETQPFPQIL